jgi:hypothetical protein
MKRIVLIILCFLLFLFLIDLSAETRVIPLPQIINPDAFQLDSDIMVVAQKASISVYSLRDFKIIRTFGKEGEGPGEFQLLPVGSGLEIDIFPEAIVVNSIGKTSFYSRKGEFIKEKKIQSLGHLLPLGEKFVGSAMKTDPTGKGFIREFILYDEDGETIRKICSHNLPLLQGAGSVTLLDLISRINPEYQVSGDLIYISGKQEFEIGIYDQQGRSLKAIQRDEPGVKLSEDGKEKLMQAYRHHPLYKLFWDRIKNAIAIPDRLPPFKTFIVSDHRVYVQTFTRQNGNTRFLVFNRRGNFVKTLYLPLAYQDMVTPHLYSISGSRLYQLVEDETSEEWTLRISPLN